MMFGFLTVDLNYLVNRASRSFHVAKEQSNKPQLFVLLFLSGHAGGGLGSGADRILLKRERMKVHGPALRNIRCVGVPVFEDQSLKQYVGSALDITEHELVTQELGRREAYLAEAQRLSHTGSFGWKPDTGEIVWTEET